MELLVNMLKSLALLCLVLHAKSAPPVASRSAKDLRQIAEMDDGSVIAIGEHLNFAYIPVMATTNNRGSSKLPVHLQYALKIPSAKYDSGKNPFTRIESSLNNYKH
jgi:hypothetical protein